jgi:hypothetical protein
MAIETIKAEDAKVGFSCTADKATFDKLIKLSGAETMEAWSKTIRTLIQHAK